MDTKSTGTNLALSHDEKPLCMNDLSYANTIKRKSACSIELPSALSWESIFLADKWAIYPTVSDWNDLFTAECAICNCNWNVILWAKKAHKDKTDWQTVGSAAQSSPTEGRCTFLHSTGILLQYRTAKSCNLITNTSPELHIFLSFVTCLRFTLSNARNSLSVDFAPIFTWQSLCRDIYFCFRINGGGRHRTQNLLNKRQVP